MPTVARGHHYKVKKQEQGTHFNTDGSTHKQWTVHVEHENGTAGTVEMPDAYYTAENVHNAIMEQAHAVHEVAHLPETAQHLPAPSAQQA